MGESGHWGKVNQEAGPGPAHLLYKANSLTVLGVSENQNLGRSVLLLYDDCID